MASCSSKATTPARHSPSFFPSSAATSFRWIDQLNANPSVLVIDDEAAILDTMRILLRNEGFTPHTALGGRDGLQQIAELKPEIVLSDVRMPDISGLDVLTAARTQDPDAAVILMTAQASLQSRSEEHTSELQSHHDLVCRLLLEKKKKKKIKKITKKKNNIYFNY